MVALSKAAQEVIWLRRFVSELLGGEFTVPSTIDVDNNATLDLVDNRTHHSRSDQTYQSPQKLRSGTQGQWGA